MKFRIAFSALLIAVSVGLIVSYLLSFPQPREFEVYIGGEGEYEYVTAVLKCSFPKVPDEVPALRVVRHYYTEDEAITIARDIFNITGELEIIYRPRPTGDMAMEITNHEESLCLFYEGSIEYWTSHDPSKKPSNLPSPEHAKEIADYLLAKVENLRDPSLQIAFESVKTGEEYGARAYSWVVSLSVNYEVRYAGMPIIGGSEVTVSIGDKGKIIDFQGDWRNVEPGDHVSITVTPEEALMNLGELPRLGSASPKKIIINNIRLGYWAEGVLDRQDTLLPVYVFEGTIITETDETLPIQIPSPAITPS